MTHHQFFRRALLAPYGVPVVAALLGTLLKLFAGALGTQSEGIAAATAVAWAVMYIGVWSVVPYTIALPLIWRRMREVTGAENLVRGLWYAALSVALGFGAVVAAVVLATGDLAGVVPAAFLYGGAAVLVATIYALGIHAAHALATRLGAVR